MTEHPAIEKPEHPAIMNLMREMLKHRCVLPQGRELEELARAAYRLVAEDMHWPMVDEGRHPLDAITIEMNSRIDARLKEVLGDS